MTPAIIQRKLLASKLFNIGDASPVILSSKRHVRLTHHGSAGTCPADTKHPLPTQPTHHSKDVKGPRKTHVPRPRNSHWRRWRGPWFAWFPLRQKNAVAMMAAALLFRLSFSLPPQSRREAAQGQTKAWKHMETNKLHPRRPQTVFPYPLQRLRACLWF